MMKYLGIWKDSFSFKEKEVNVNGYVSMTWKDLGLRHVYVAGVAVDVAVYEDKGRGVLATPSAQEDAPGRCPGHQRSAIRSKVRS